jgi:hypothetical protein
MSSLLKLSLSSTSPHTFPPANNERILLPQREDKEEIERYGILLVFATGLRIWMDPYSFELLDPGPPGSRGHGEPAREVATSLIDAVIIFYSFQN